jgi:hypothetical protein
LAQAKPVSQAPGGLAARADESRGSRQQYSARRRDLFATLPMAHALVRLLLLRSGQRQKCLHFIHYMISL